MMRRLATGVTALALLLGVVLTMAAAPHTASGGVLSPPIIDQYIVVLQPGADPRVEAAAAQQTYGVQVRHVYEHAVQGFAFHGPPQAAQALAHNPRVKFVSPDQEMRAFDQILPTGIDRIAADLNTIAHIDGVDQRVNVNVAIVDTGIDPTHPDLNIAGGTDCTSSGSFADANGHGTHVAGIVGALDNPIGVVGVAPGVRLWAARVLDANGNGTLSSVICGIDWVTSTRTDGDPSNDIAVANLSLGGSGTDDANCGNTNNDALHQAICDSTAKGVVYVVAAGNQASDVTGFVPAAYGEVLTVSAMIDSDGKPGGLGPVTSSGPDDTLATFSNDGSRVAVAAPGVDILSTYIGGGYATMSGTSMAASHVSGAVALCVAANGLASDAAGAAAIRQNIVGPDMGYSIAQSDPKGFGGDTDGSSEPLVYVGSPDVAVTAVVAPASVLQGQSVAISIDVANQGALSEPFTVTLTDTTAGTTISSQSITLAAGASTTLAFTWATSSTIVLGDHVLRADVAPVPNETNIADNSRMTTITVGKHDVAITDMTAPTEVLQGNSTAVQVGVVNPGTYSESLTVTLSDATASLSLGTQTVSLSAGASAVLSFTWTMPSATVLGPHTLTATAAMVPDESNTTNNTASATATIVGAMHVGNLDAISTKLQKRAWKSTVTITVHDGSHNPLAGAIVSGTFAQGTWSKAVSCTTGSSGTCTVDSGTFPTTQTTASFTVNGISQADYRYIASVNHDPDGDSNGTTISLSR